MVKCRHTHVILTGEEGHVKCHLKVTQLKSIIHMLIHFVADVSSRFIYSKVKNVLSRRKPCGLGYDLDPS